MVKKSKTCIITVTEEKETGMIVQEVMVENFPKLMKDIKLQIQEVLISLSRRNTKHIIPRPIILKLWKTKRKCKIRPEKQKSNSCLFKKGDILKCKISLPSIFLSFIFP